MMDASATNPRVGPPWSRSNGLTPGIMWVARNAGVADPPKDTHIPLRHLNCLAMKDEMDLGVGCRSLLTSEHGAHGLRGDGVGTALRCARMDERVGDTVIKVGNGWGWGEEDSSCDNK